MRFKPVKKETFALFSLAGIFTLVGVLYLLQISKKPFFGYYLGDSMYFDKYARAIAQGDIFGNEVFHKAPFYQYFLGLIYAVFDWTPFMPRLIQIFLNSISSIFVFFIAKNIFGKKTAWTSFFFVSLNGVLIYFSGEILMPTLLTFLILFSIYLFLRTHRSGSSVLYFFTGFAFGLASITRPNFLAAATVLIAVSVIRGKKTLIKKNLLLIFGLIIPIIPVTLSNFFAGKDFVPISSQGGVIFYIGNNRLSDGMTAVIPGAGDDWDEIALAERETGRTMKPFEASGFWSNKTFKEIGENPVFFIVLILKKTAYFFYGFEIPNNKNIYLATRGTFLSFFVKKIPLPMGWSLFIPSGILLPLGLSGMIVSLRNRKALPLVLTVLSYAVSIIVFFVFSRLRAPLLPLFSIFAAFFTVKIYQELKNKRFLAFSLPLFLILFLFSNYEWIKSDFSSQAMHHFNLGLKHLNKSDLGKASLEFQTCLRLNPVYPRANLNLGLISQRCGDLNSAKYFYEREKSLHPEEFRVYNNLAVVNSLEGQDSLAIENWKRAIRINPRYTQARINLAIKYEYFGFQDSAIIQYNQILEYDRKSISALLGRARIHHASGRLQESANDYENAIAIDAGNYEGYFNYSLLLSQNNNYDSALTLLMKSTQLNPDFAPAYNNIGLCFYYKGDFENALYYLKKAVSLDYESIQSHLALALVYEAIGQTEKAVSERRIASSLSEEIKQDL
ncbi:tetratricopeptide repeat protein [candidate division WOR-3 bacterium]|nr:tetratricopeptide repeat protein [candidate division WOR-3 bacterium]